MINIAGRSGAFRVFIAFSLVFLALLQTASAQIPVPAPAPASVPADLASPSATLHTFFYAMAGGTPADARKTLDLSSISFALRDSEGNRRAMMLLTILDRASGFKPGEAPATPAASVLRFDIPIEDSHRTEYGIVTLAKQDNGAWLFSSATVSELPSIYERVRDLPKVYAYGPEEEVSVGPSPLLDHVPAAFRHSVLYLEIWQWLALSILAVAGLFLALLVRVLTKLVLGFFFRHWETSLEKRTLKKLRRALGVLGATALWRAAYLELGLPDWALASITLFVKLAWALGAIALMFALFDITLELAGSRASNLLHRADHILIPVARKFGKFVIFVLVALGFAASMDVNVAGLVAGLGIGGLVVALAAKDSVENIFGSLTILFDMPFGIGDYIKIGEIQGTVEEINLRSTRIRTGPDTVINLPNSNLIKAAVENFSLRRFRAFSTQVVLPYTNDLPNIDDFLQKVRETLVSNDRIQGGSVYVQLDGLGESAVRVTVQAVLLTTDYSEELSLKNQILAGILSNAKATGVELGVQPAPPQAAGGSGNFSISINKPK